MKKFDYYVLDEEQAYPDPEDVIRVLSHLGANGWELVTVIVNDGGEKTFYFKRERDKVKILTNEETAHHVNARQ